MRSSTVLAGIAAVAALVAGNTRIGVAQGGGTISGKVTFAGAAPAAKKLPVTKDNKVCGSEKVIEEVAVGTNNGLKNAVVMVVGVKKGTPGPAAAVLDQKGCEFNPRVVVLPAGGSLDILNSDGILHNIHSQSTANPSINKAQPGFRKKMTEKFESAEVVKVVCDVHSWMWGWVVVSDGFAAVTDASGNFQIANVPPGNYKLELWHETLGKQTKGVAVKASADAKVNFDLK